MCVLRLRRGLKGLQFSRAVLTGNYPIDEVWTYEDIYSLKQYSGLLLLAANHGLPARTGRRPTIKQGELVFVIGWQYLLEPTEATGTGFDTSLLTDQAFSPAVNALGSGKEETVVTSLAIGNNVDDGEIFDQQRSTVINRKKIGKSAPLPTLALLEFDAAQAAEVSGHDDAERS